MTLTEREAKILNAAVEAFIEHGEPVSSQWLYDHYRFGIKPAMIRHELEELTEDGYLAQPYHSAGRIPCDKGFEFFARAALREVKEEMAATNKALRGLFERRAWDDLLAELADELGVLGAFGNARGEVVKEGLECLMENFPWERREEVAQVIRDFVELDARLEAVAAHWEGEPLQVFVGKRSPVTKSDGLAVVMGQYRTPENEVVVCTVGPKRMDYRKVIRAMRDIGN
jgi:transcriptional regulator of heat shock response